MNILQTGKLNLWRFRAFAIALISCILMAAPDHTCAQKINDSLSGRLKSSVKIKLPAMQDSLRYELQKKRIESSSEFYKKVKFSAQSNFFYRNLYPILFRKPPAVLSSEIISASDSLPYLTQKDKIIRSVRIYKAPVFGSSIFDTSVISSNWTDRLLNSIHFNTNDAVIRSYLNIRKGDMLNPVILADNERIIRQSALFEDARFIVSSQPGSDSVDVVLVIKDVFPLGFDLTVKKATNSTIRLYNRNILGFGHQLEQLFDINTNKSPYVAMSAGGYKIRNIMRTFTDLDLVWKNMPEMKKMEVRISKPFVSPETRSGGGIDVQKISTLEISGESNAPTRLDYNIYDFWGGYATIINRFKSLSGERAVFTITGRYYNINYQHIPPVVPELQPPAVTLNRYITSLSLVRSGFYRSNMMYGFGHTEDIQIGRLAQITMGYETSILANRYYSGFKLISGEKITKDRFIYSWLEGGGYWSAGHFNDGIINMGFDYISGLYKAGSYRLRSFLSMSYKSGIMRESFGELAMNSNEFLKTFKNFNQSGHQRLGAKAETVIFTPYYLLGFRFAAYSFIEAAMVTSSGKFVLSGSVYPAIGLGLRIRNENLVFSTFQLGLNWYGRPDSKGRYLMFEFTDIPQVRLGKLNIGAPEFATYR